MSTSPAPTVSVLVPSYNKAAYVGETLASVYAQTLRDFELIVVDDGSTDGSAALLEAHRERATIVLGPNRGASAARQHALELSRGRYVLYLDADDVLLPDALSHCVQALERSGADVAYGDFQRYVKRDDGSFARDEVVSTCMEDVDRDPEIACFTRFWVPPAALLYRRTLIDRLPPWNPRLPVIQDARYLQEAALAGARFVRVPRVLALYRQDEHNSLSKRSQLGFARDVYVNAREIEAAWRARGALDAARRKALAGVFDYVARAAFAVDAALFDDCVRGLAELGELRALGWPNVAAQLRAMLGTERALAALSRLRRPGLT